MTERELDTVYTHMCKMMTGIGEDGAPLFLARVALLALIHISDSEAALKLIDDATKGMIGVSP